MSKTRICTLSRWNTLSLMEFYNFFGVQLERATADKWQMT